ncbi:MAG: FAD/NAD(P)-binding oxidoreductase [Candidatus Caldarchaeum sp.]|nr:NAD(P)/FAD-dependent oxidoreductase [Candidatus Caldarchaeum sp.]MCX8200622.1 NAD(P)/FAD-dependent oxidoreductase [Candidatus Caldarchaeum sp.]MDW8063850.1 FAD/NAD(P)-binding oxidoreductase [Candidatus Caldarchaeum sp.]MDW8435315.1 FAD/NAD(P)-binding oxidoreductase [Candidatus Caldarchaeum sp.]
MKRILIVGGGTGGTLAANLLASKLGGEISSGKASVTVVSDNPQHVFQPANLEVALHGARPDKYVRKESTLLDRKIQFLNEKVERINIADRLLHTTVGNELRYDYLVLATGSIADPSLVPGLAEGSLNFHVSPWDSAKVWDALSRFDGGKVVLVIAGVPHKCPPAPTEAMFLLDEHFRKRGIRDKVELTFLTPYPHAYPAKTIADIVQPLLEKKGVNIVPFFNIESVDPVKKRVYSLEGEEVPYDLLLSIPPHRGAKVMTVSEIGDKDGWVPADKHLMTVSGYDDVFAIGDATNIPVSKSGVVAHIQAGIVAHNIASEIIGEDGEKRYNGRINCPLEVGGGKALFVSSTYTRPPKHMEPTRIRYLMKKSFASLYWTMLRGKLEPIFDIYFKEKEDKAS